MISGALQSKLSLLSYAETGYFFSNENPLPKFTLTSSGNQSCTATKCTHADFGIYGINSRCSESRTFRMPSSWLAGGRRWLLFYGAKAGGMSIGRRKCMSMVKIAAQPESSENAGFLFVIQ